MLRKWIGKWADAVSAPPEHISVLVASCTPTNGILYLDADTLEAWAESHYVSYSYAAGELFYIGKARCFTEKDIVRMFALAYLREKINKAGSPLERARAALHVLGAQITPHAGPLAVSIWYCLNAIVEHLEAPSQ